MNEHGRCWVVDGLNLIGSRPDGWWRDRPAAMRRLAGELDGFATRTGEPVTLVLDGRPIELPPVRHVLVVFAGSSAPNAGDHRIVELVRGSGHAEQLVVVSSDRNLVARVGALGARTEGAGRFRARLEGEPTAPDAAGP